MVEGNAFVQNSTEYQDGWNGLGGLTFGGEVSSFKHNFDNLKKRQSFKFVIKSQAMGTVVITSYSIHYTKLYDIINPCNGLFCTELFSDDAGGEISLFRGCN